MRSAEQTSFPPSLTRNTTSCSIYWGSLTKVLSFLSGRKSWEMIPSIHVGCSRVSWGMCFIGSTLLLNSPRATPPTSYHTLGSFDEYASSSLSSSFYARGVDSSGSKTFSGGNYTGHLEALLAVRQRFLVRWNSPNSKFRTTKNQCPDELINLLASLLVMASPARSKR